MGTLSFDIIEIKMIAKDDCFYGGKMDVTKKCGFFKRALYFIVATYKR